MIIVRLIHTIIFYFIMAISFFIGSVFLVLFVSPFSKNKPRSFQIGAHVWAKLLLFSAGIKVKLSGISNISKDQAYIIASNHQGAADISIVLASFPLPFRFAIKKELFKIPFFGWFLRKADYVSIDRKAILRAYRSVNALSEYLKKGESVLVFPEGTRTRTGELGKFKRGSLLAGLKSKCPILPVAISGSYNVIPAKTWLIYPCPVKLTVGKPIYIQSEADYENKVEEVRQAIADML